jgi:hypothetical protein
MDFLKFKLRYFVMLVALVSSTILLTSCPPDKDNYLTVNPTEFTFDANETGEQTALITTDASFVESIPSAEWIEPRIQGTTLLSIRVAPHLDASSSRTGTITINAGTAIPVNILVRQGAKETLSLSQTSLTIDSDDTNGKTINVSTNSTKGWNFTVSDASWLTCTKNNNDLIVRANNNNNGQQERKATITVTAGSAEPVVLTVIHRPLTFTVSTSSINFPYNSQSSSFSITSNTSWTVSRGTASWLTLSTSSGSNNGTVTVTASANSSTSSRSATITVSNPSGLSRTVNVTQDGRTPPPPPATAQVRFRKLIYTSELTRLGVFTTGGSELASYNFGASTGTSSYSTITSGTHQPRFYEGSWTNMSSTFNFQANRRYTVELTSETTTTWRFTFYEEGSSTTQQGVMINDAVQQPKVFDIPKNR